LDWDIGGVNCTGAMVTTSSLAVQATPIGVFLNSAVLPGEPTEPRHSSQPSFFFFFFFFNTGTGFENVDSPCPIKERGDGFSCG
jgi:hypothetical protein